MEDDKKSVSRDSTVANNTISIIRNNILDELVFNLLMTFHKVNDFPRWFSIICLFWTVLNGISVTFTFNNWPLWGYTGKVVHDFFSWTDFTVSWQYDSFLLVMNIIFYVITITVVIGLSVLTVLNKKEKIIPVFVTKLIGGTQYLLTHLFSYSGVNVMMGYFWCIGPRSSPSDPYPTVHLSCSSMHTMLIIVSTVVLLIFFIVGVLERMFVFVYDSKQTPGDPFTGQSGFYNAMTCILLNIFSVISLFLRFVPAAIAVIGLLFFFILCAYAYIYQPYYFTSGNALSAGLFAFSMITFIFACGTLLIKDNYYLYDRLLAEERTKDKLPLPIGLVALFWILYIITSIGGGFLIAWLTYRKGKKEWAMDMNEELPTLKGAEKIHAEASLTSTLHPSRHVSDFNFSNSSLGLEIVPVTSDNARVFKGSPLNGSPLNGSPFDTPRLLTPPLNVSTPSTGTTSRTALDSSSSTPNKDSVKILLSASPSLPSSRSSSPSFFDNSFGPSVSPDACLSSVPPISCSFSSSSPTPPLTSLCPDLALSPTSSSSTPELAYAILPLSTTSSSCSSASSSVMSSSSDMSSILVPRVLPFNARRSSVRMSSSLSSSVSFSLFSPLSSSSSPLATLMSVEPEETTSLSAATKPLGPARKIPKFHKPEDVLHAIRYLGINELGRRSDCISLAEEILLTGRKKFPTSSVLWIGTALFHLVYTGNNAHMGEALRNAHQFIPTFVERWLIHVLMRDMDKRLTQDDTDGDTNKAYQAGQSSTISFRLGFARAQKAYELSKAYLLHAYGLLGKAHVDLNRSMGLLEKAIQHENTARNELNELYETYPKSVQVLRLFGSLLRDIYRDDEMATQLFMHAIQIEDENQESERREQPDKGTRMDGAPCSEKVKKKKMWSNKKDAIVMQKKKEKILTLFFPLLALNFMVCLASVMVGFILTLSTFSKCKNTVSIINDITSMMTFLINQQLMMRLKNYLDINEELTGSNSYIFSRTTIDTYLLEDKMEVDRLLDKVYSATTNKDEFALWETEYIRNAITVTRRLPSGEYTPKKIFQRRLNLLQLIKNIGNIAFDFVYKFNSSSKSTKRHMQDNIFYTRINIAVVTMESMKKTALHYAANSRRNSNTQMWIGIIQGSVCISFNMIVILVQYYIYTKRLNKERREVFQAFLMAPKEKIHRLRKRIEDVDKEDDDNDDNNANAAEHTISETVSNEDFVDGDIDNIFAAEENFTGSDASADVRSGLDINAALTGPETISFPPAVFDLSENEGSEDKEEDNSSDDEGTRKRKKKRTAMKEIKRNKEKEKETKKMKEKRTEEGIVAEEQNKERDRLVAEKAEKEERERQEMEEASMDMTARVARMQSSIPSSFFINVIIGFFFLIICPIAFYVICAVAVHLVVQRDMAIFMCDYRIVVMQLITQCALFMIKPQNFDIGIYGLSPCDFATTPMWSGFELVTHNRTVLQEAMGRAIELLVQLNRVIIEGQTVDDRNHVTADSLLDAFASPRTTTKKSKTIGLLYDKTNCFEMHPGDCTKNASQRIPTLDNEFGGLSALLDFFVAHAMILQKWDFRDASHPMLMETPSVQATVACMLYDLRAGITKYREILVAEQERDIDIYQTLLILFFILSVFMPLTGFVCFLMPTREVLFGVAFVSHKLVELNPTNENSSKSALGAAQWNETYAVDASRYDNGHHAMCVLAASLIVEMDKSMDVGSQSMQEVNDIKNKLVMIRKENEKKFAEERAAQLSLKGFTEEAIGVDIERELKRLKRDGMIKNPIAQALLNLIVTSFAVLFDEENIMLRYRVSEQHRRSHFNSHVVFLRKLQTLSLNIVATVSRQNKGRLKDYSPEYSRHSQMLIQTMAAYMTDHVGKMDREMVLHIPESELTNVEINLTQRAIPRSLRIFLTSDNASIQDRHLFEKLMKVLHFE